MLGWVAAARYMAMKTGVSWVPKHLAGFVRRVWVLHEVWLVGSHVAPGIQGVSLLLPCVE